MAVEVLHEYPPYPYLFQILEHCPKSGLVYMQLWKLRDKNSRVVVDKKDIRTEFLMTGIKFRNDLLSLVREGLCNVDESPQKIYIELVDFQEGVEY